MKKDAVRQDVKVWGADIYAATQHDKPCSTTSSPHITKTTLSSMNSSFIPSSTTRITNLTPSSIQISETPTSFFKQTTNSAKTSPLYETTTASSGNTPETVSAVIIGAVIVLGALIVLYGVSSYQSYRVLRRNDEDSSTCQLMGRALANPMYFYTHQHQATDRRAEIDLLAPRRGIFQKIFQCDMARILSTLAQYSIHNS